MSVAVHTFDTSRAAAAMCEHLHWQDIGAWCEVVQLAFEAARIHGIELQDVLPDSTATRPGFGTFCWGYCRPEAHEIHVCIRMKNNDGKWLARVPSHEYLDTLAHELAHFIDRRHGDAHRRATANILETIQELRRNR